VDALMQVILGIVLIEPNGNLSKHRKKYSQYKKMW
jgi:hypothetical protein